MAFTYRLVLEDGSPADPPTFVSSEPNWQVGDRIPRGPNKPAFEVVGVRAASGPQHQALLVVEAS